MCLSALVGGKSGVLDSPLTQCQCCVMIPPFDESGLLPPGVHWASWDEFIDRLGTSSWRLLLAAGIRAAIDNLKESGCVTVYINGSIDTVKEIPNDFDACWEEVGVDPLVLDPVLLTFEPGRTTQKLSTWENCFRDPSLPAGTDSRFWSSSKRIRTPEDPKGLSPLTWGGLR